MTTKDLCIGNWVTDYNRIPMLVQAIYDKDTVYLDFDGYEGDTWELDINDVRPIELTREIIEKIGFKVEEGLIRYNAIMQMGNYALTINTLSNTKGRSFYLEVDNEFASLIGGCDIQYVHELQNIVRLATGKDLEVKI